MIRPKLRPYLDIQQMDHEGQRFLVLRDPFSIAPEPAVLSIYYAPVLQRANGNHSIEDLVQAGALHGVPEEYVRSLFKELDALCFLENERFSLEYQRVLKEFQDSPIRKAALAGPVYSPVQDALTKELETYINAAEVDVTPASTELRAAMCPHIDYMRGHKTYGATFSYLRKVERPDTIFLIGTCHKPSTSRFIACAKGFETPLGTFNIQQEPLEDLLSVYGRNRLLDEEMLHKDEHSLELQLPFLAWLYGGDLPKIVPILVGSFYDSVISNQLPREHSEIGDFIAALKEAVKNEIGKERRVWLFGGVDLAHVGEHFGDEKTIAPSGLPQIALRDYELIETLKQNSSEKLFAHIAEDGDQRRVCGFPSLYVMLEVMKSLDEKYAVDLIEYRQSVDHVHDCIVTYAGLAWGKI